MNVPKSKIRDQLAEVGFDDARQSDIVGGLSGGWKMKLELARAMLYNADLLLLDEVMFFLISLLPQRLIYLFLMDSLLTMSVLFGLIVYLFD